MAPGKVRLDVFQERLVLAIGVAKNRGKSERAIERDAGLSSGQLRKWKIGARGKRIGADTIEGLAGALGVSEEWLRGKDVPMNANASSLEEQALAGLPAVDAEARAIVRSIYARFPKTDPATVREILIGAGQDIVRIRSEQLQAKRPRQRKPKAAPKSQRAAAPKSRRGTGTE